MYLPQPDRLRRQTQLVYQTGPIFFDSGPIIPYMGGKIQTIKGPRTHPAGSEGCQRLDMCWGRPLGCLARDAGVAHKMLC